MKVLLLLLEEEEVIVVVGVPIYLDVRCPSLDWQGDVANVSLSVLLLRLNCDRRRRLFRNIPQCKGEALLEHFLHESNSQ